MSKIYILLVFALFACREDDLKTPYDLYNEWRWVETDFGSRVPYKTSDEVDTTFYFNFQKNGILQVKDNEKNVINNTQFKIGPDKVITISNTRSSYSIDNDTLTIKNIDGVI